MKYIALLRGINVGGTATVGMAELKTCFEAAGMESVRTYINSGNVIFDSSHKNIDTLTGLLEESIEKQFDLPVRVLLKTPEQLAAINHDVPGNWVNDAVTKCDVLLLWPESDNPAVLEQIPFRPEIETIRYTPGAVVHMVPKKDAAKSRVNRIIGTDLYQQMTLRNINTVRKLIGLCR